jgi:hypothetical protein
MAVDDPSVTVGGGGRQWILRPFANLLMQIFGVSGDIRPNCQANLENPPAWADSDGGSGGQFSIEWWGDVCMCVCVYVVIICCMYVSLSSHPPGNSLTSCKGKKKKL